MCRGSLSISLEGLGRPMSNPVSCPSANLRHNTGGDIRVIEELHLCRLHVVENADAPPTVPGTTPQRMPGIELTANNNSFLTRGISSAADPVQCPLSGHRVGPDSSTPRQMSQSTLPAGL